MYSAEHWTTGWLTGVGVSCASVDKRTVKELQCAVEERSLLGQDMIITTYLTFLTIHAINPS